MRLPRPRIHLVNCASPLHDYSDLTGRCGERIINGEPRFMYTEDSPRVYQIGICRKCILLPPQIQVDRRYEYGVIEAEGAFQAEAEAS